MSEHHVAAGCAKRAGNGAFARERLNRWTQFADMLVAAMGSRQHVSAVDHHIQTIAAHSRLAIIDRLWLGPARLQGEFGMANEGITRCPADESLVVGNLSSEHDAAIPPPQNIDWMEAAKLDAHPRFCWKRNVFDIIACPDEVHRIAAKPSFAIGGQMRASTNGGDAQKRRCGPQASQAEAFPRHCAQPPNRAFNIAKQLRNACASPPAGRPGRSVSFQL